MLLFIADACNLASHKSHSQYFKKSLEQSIYAQLGCSARECLRKSMVNLYYDIHKNWCCMSIELITCIVLYPPFFQHSNGLFEVFVVVTQLFDYFSWLFITVSINDVLFNKSYSSSTADLCKFRVMHAVSCCLNNWPKFS